jgi:hypothetical protein
LEKTRTRGSKIENVGGEICKLLYWLPSIGTFQRKHRSNIYCERFSTLQLIAASDGSHFAECIEYLVDLKNLVLSSTFANQLLKFSRKISPLEEEKWMHKLKPLQSLMNSSDGEEDQNYWELREL